MGSERGGAVDGQRSISGRACLPVLLFVIAIGAIVAGSFGVVAIAMG